MTDSNINALDLENILLQLAFQGICLKRKNKFALLEAYVIVWLVHLNLN